MEIIAAIALGAATYAYLDKPSQTEVVEYKSPIVSYEVTQEQPNVQWVFING